MLNITSIWIEEQPEFKDGDIVVISDDYTKSIAIFKEFNDFGNKISTYVELTPNTNNQLCFGNASYKLGLSVVRMAKKKEKRQLFDALAKEGKRWNAEAKTLEDLPKKHEFKPFERVLVRDYDDEEWCASFFSHYADKEKTQTITVNDYGSQQCIPYEGNEHLLGTTDSPSAMYN